MLPRSRFIFWLLLFTAATASGQANESLTPGPCTTIVFEYLRQKVLDQQGPDAAALYARIHEGNRFHPNKAIRESAFRLLSQPGVDLQIVDLLGYLPQSEIAALVTDLERLPPQERQSVLSSVHNWNAWKDKALPRAVEALSLQYVDVEGYRFERQFYEATVKYQEELRKRGIKTRLVPGMTRDYSTQGKGVLVIEGIDTEGREALKPGNDPTMNIFESQEFVDYLKKAGEQLGAIVVDPTTFWHGRPFFWKNPAVVQGKLWVIGVHEGVNWALFQHEWQHKIDFVDDNEMFPGAVAPTKTNTRKTRLGRALFEAGKSLERNYISELNATAKELELYFENDKKPWKGTVIYRLENQRRVAIGRILVDPLNPGHYWLYLKSRGRFYLPVAGLTALTAAGATAEYYGVRQLLLLINGIMGDTVNPHGPPDDDSDEHKKPASAPGQ